MRYVVTERLERAAASLKMVGCIVVVAILAAGCGGEPSVTGRGGDPLGAGEAPYASTTQAITVSNQGTITVPLYFEPSNALFACGWYSALGNQTRGNTNYVVAQSLEFHGEVRNFLAFDLTGVSGSIAAASIRIQNPSPMAIGAATYSLHDVSTPVSALVAKTGGLAVFDDLGTGVLYGSVSTDGTASEITVPLNADAVAAIQAKLGATPFVVGGRLEGAVPETALFGWTGANPAGAAELVLTMHTSLLTLNYLGTGTGSVTPSVGGVNLQWNSCTATSCSVLVPLRGTVKLTATPGANSVFRGWAGCQVGAIPTECNVSMIGARTATAKFEPARFPLSVSIRGTGGVHGTTSVDNGAPAAIVWNTCGPDPKYYGGTLCTTDVANGATVSLTATPAPLATFKGWAVICSGTAGCTFKMNAAKNPWATFTTAAWSFEPINYIGAELAVLDRTQFPTLNQALCAQLCLSWGTECVAASWCDETTPFGYANMCVLRSAANSPHALQGVSSWLRPGTVVVTPPPPPPPPPPVVESTYGFYDVLQGNTKWTGWVPVWAQRIDVAAPTTLYRLGAVTNHNAVQLRMALYADAGGVPGALLAQTDFSQSVVGRNEVAIGGASGIALGAGAYWVALQFDSDAGYLMGGSVAPTAPRAYADASIAAPLPATFVLDGPVQQLNAVNLYAVGVP